MDLTKFALVVMKNVRDFVQPALDAFDKRIAATEARLAEVEAVFVARADAKPEKGEPGKDADPEFVRAEVAKAVAGLPIPKNGLDGKDADPELVRAEVAKAVAAIPLPKDGKDADPEAIKAEVAKAVAALPPASKGDPGKSVTPEDARPMLEAMVKALPVPKNGEDGKSVSLDDLLPVVESFLAKWALETERRVMDQHQRFMDSLPRPKDGKDGSDGFGFEDLSVEYDGARTVNLKFVRDGRTKEFPIRLPVPIYRGVWTAGAYEECDTATRSGSLWQAQRNTDGVPGVSADWKLVVKAGRDGKQGEPGKDFRPQQPVKLESGFLSPNEMRKLEGGK